MKSHFVTVIKLPQNKEVAFRSGYKTQGSQILPGY